MKRSHSIIITLCFLLPLLFVGIWSLADADRRVSEDENRTLAQWPEFSWERLFSGVWMSDFNAYYSDQFPGREDSLPLGQSLQQLYSIPLRDGATIIGGDFDMGEGVSLEDLIGVSPTPSPTATPSPSPTPEDSSPSPSPSATPSPSPTPEPTPSPTPEPTPEPNVDYSGGGYLVLGDRILHMVSTNSANCEVYAAQINALQEKLPEVNVAVLIAPNSFAFYAPSRFITDSYNQQSMIQNVHALLDEDVIAVNAYDSIAAHTEEYLYFRTDHHWTARGAYRAYVAFCDAMGFTPSDISEWEYGVYDDFLGSFYSEMKAYGQEKAVEDKPDSCEYFVPPTEYTAYSYKTTALTGGIPIPMVNKNLGGQKNRYVCFTNGDQPIIHVSTATKNGRSILVAKESYGNAMIPFLLAHYEDIYVVDYRKFNTAKTTEFRASAFITEHGIDDFLALNYAYVPNASNFLGLFKGVVQ